MHTIQYVAVKADNPEMAHDSVKEYLESQMGSGDNITSWYDWFVTGGGRWASKEEAQYDDNYTEDVVHQDTPKFQEYLDNAHKWKLEAVAADVEHARKVDVPALLDKIENDKEGLYPMWDLVSDLYAFRRLSNHVSGSWDYDSYFFDLEHETTHPTYMREGIDKGDKNWYLVPVDFHF